MEYLIVIGVAVVLFVTVLLVRDAMKKSRDRRTIHDRIHSTADRYAFLINRGFEVEDTNYYDLNKSVERRPPYVLGNVLHCQTGTDCGLCGTGFACQSCPVRFVIKNAFLQQHDVEGVEATMQLYDAEMNVQNVDVRLNGKLVYLNYQPHMMLEVEDVTAPKSDEKPDLNNHHNENHDVEETNE